MSENPPSVPQQVDAENRCGNCRWLEPITGYLGGYCRVPLPCWVMDDFDALDDFMGNHMGAGCGAWEAAGGAE